MLTSVHRDHERLVVVVAAHFTLRHAHPSVQVG
jgi:hypothetical protein